MPKRIRSFTSRVSTVAYPLREQLRRSGTTNTKAWMQFLDIQYNQAMARSVTISTPVPTLEEFGKSLGLSKTRRDSLLKLVRRGSGPDRFAMKKGDTAGIVRDRVASKS